MNYIGGEGFFCADMHQVHTKSLQILLSLSSHKRKGPPTGMPSCKRCRDSVLENVPNPQSAHENPDCSFHQTMKIKSFIV